jgi:glycosyltransferase involved in cell wall biosynthesis
LHVGSCDPRKNVEGLLHIVAELRGVAPAACLLQVGGCFSPLQRALITQLGIAEAVTQLERMSEEGLRLAYHAADVLLLPSLYEGFGFPILEAQAAALPVLCSDRGSLPDIAGDGAVVLDPTQPSAWATSMLEVVEGATRRDRLVAKGLRNARHYTWQRTAASVATIYEELLGS